MPAQLLVPEQPGPDGMFYILDAQTRQPVDPTPFPTHAAAVQAAQQLYAQNEQQQPELGGLRQPNPGMIQQPGAPRYQ